jgi:hypothetical protein
MGLAELWPQALALVVLLAVTLLVATRLLALLRLETIQLLRDRRLLAFVLGITVLELALYGYATHLTDYHLPTAVVDQSRDRKSREFMQELVNSQYFDVALYAASQDEAQAAINRGVARAAAITLPSFACLVDEGQADVLILVDGTDNAGVQSGYSAAALIAQNYAAQVTTTNVGQTDHRAAAEAGGLPITASTQVLYNPDMIDILFILPGLAGLGLGLLLSTRANTQMEASQLSLILMMFGILLSGFMYPVNTMPAPLRLVGALFPVTCFMGISRGIFLKGVGLSVVWTDALVLALYAVVIVVIAARSFRPRLD